MCYIKLRVTKLVLSAQATFWVGLHLLLILTAPPDDLCSDWKQSGFSVCFLFPLALTVFGV